MSELIEPYVGIIATIIAFLVVFGSLFLVCWLDNDKDDD